MRRRLVLPLLLSWPLVPAASCGLVAFDVAQPVPEQVVPGSPIGGLGLPLTLFEIPFDVDLEAQTKAQGTGPARSVRLKQVTLVTTNPSGATFSFLEALTLHVSAEGLAEQEIARLLQVPAQKEISLEVLPDVELLPYVKKGAKLRASAKGRMPAQDTTIAGKVVLRVKV